jgi:hypothetical protein
VGARDGAVAVASLAEPEVRLAELIASMSLATESGAADGARVAIACMRVGPSGRVVGVDFTPEQLF